jgi:hypothetical protein
MRKVDQDSEEGLRETAKELLARYRGLGHPEILERWASMKPAGCVVAGLVLLLRDAEPASDAEG